MKSPEGFAPVGSTPRGLRFGSGVNNAEVFKNEVCVIYDLLIGKGIEQKEAIRQTRAILKAINYHFATYDMVMTKLRASGRFRKVELNKM